MLNPPRQDEQVTAQAVSNACLFECLMEDEEMVQAEKMRGNVYR